MTNNDTHRSFGLTDVMGDEEKVKYHANFMRMLKESRDKGQDIITWDIKPRDVWAIDKFGNLPHEKYGKADYIYSDPHLPAIIVDTHDGNQYIYFESGCYFSIITQDEHETEPEFFARCNETGSFGWY